jgi:hypothetical protein
MTVPVKDAEAALKSLGMSEKGMEKDPGSIGNGRTQQIYQRLGGFQWNELDLWRLMHFSVLLAHSNFLRKA